MRRWIIALIGVFLSGCAGIPPGITPVGALDIPRYLGTWYEIARLDHPFERGLSDVSATYRLRGDGGIDVINRGYDPGTGRWRQALGRAYSVGEGARLKVSFFRPIYGSYNILALDPDYTYAMVCGPSREYLWILARARRLEPAVLDALIRQARDLGFAVDKLIRVPQDRDNG